MNFAKFLILFALVGFPHAQIEFIQTRPGNYTPPSPPLWGVLHTTAGDTLSDKSIKNVSNKTLTFYNAGLQILSPGLEGEWRTDITLDARYPNYTSWNLYAYKSQFAYDSLVVTSEVVLHPQEVARLSVPALYECDWLLACKKDTTVSPPVYYFTYNTAKDVDTIDARLVLYWYDSLWNDGSAFIDCRIEFRRGSKYVGRIVPRSAKADASQLRNIPGGWSVASGTGWSLVDAQGHALPLRQEPMTDGLRLMPVGSRRGVGILRNREGQTYRVFMGM